MIIRRLLLFLLLFAGCASSMPHDSTTKIARLQGIVMKNDTAQMILYLAPPAGEMRDIPLVRYNTLTVLDRPRSPGRMEDLQAGEEVIIFGRENDAGDVVAERVAVQDPRNGAMSPR
jgi:hypothetical protein